MPNSCELNSTDLEFGKAAYNYTEDQERESMKKAFESEPPLVESDDRKRTIRKHVVDRWPNGIVPYTLR